MRTEVDGLSAEELNGIGKPCVGARYTSYRGDGHELLDGAVCAVCGKPATNAHHVPAKGMGGGRRLVRVGGVPMRPALIALCGSGTTGCHGLAHQRRIRFEWRWDDARFERAFLRGEVPPALMTLTGRWYVTDGSSSFPLLGQTEGRDEWPSALLTRAVEGCKALTERERAAFTLRTVEGKGWKEITSRMRVSRQNAYNANRTATRKLFW